MLIEIFLPVSLPYFHIIKLSTPGMLNARVITHLSRSDYLFYSLEKMAGMPQKRFLKDKKRDGRAVNYRFPL